MISILGLLTGLMGPLAQLASNITDLQRAKISANADVDKANINAQIEDLHDKRQVLIAEAGSRINAIVRLIAAIGPIAYVTKIFLWDKVIGAFMGCVGRGTGVDCTTFNTDPLLNDNLTWIMISVLGFYFLSTWKRNG